MMRLFVFLLLALAAQLAQAACSGCSTAAASCTDGTDGATITSCVQSMLDEGTLTLAAGTYSGRIRLEDANGITLVCATAPLAVGAATTNPCLLTGAPAVSIDHATFHHTNLMRISGFRFDATGGPVITIGNTTSDAWIDKLRIDHNTFEDNSDSIAIGHTALDTPVYGVIDQNLFEGTQGNYVIGMLGQGDNDWNLAAGETYGTLGTGNAIFIEDNTFDYNNEVSGSCNDLWNGGRQVVRFNDVTNCRMSTHGVCHGGPVLYEIYRNTMHGGPSLDGYRIIHHQGSGEFINFDNTLTGSNPATMVLQHYRSSNPNPEGCGTCDGFQSEDGNRSPTATYRGYPCYRQPGRTGNVAAASARLRPIFSWGNTVNGSRDTLSIEDAGGSSFLSEHMQHNRDWYEAVGTVQTSPTNPFNGTTGMGFGTLANRPTTCTTSADSNDATGCAGNGCGVGYWATDGGTNWNTSNGSGDDGGLYICKDTNTWELYYTPYTYPHPLRDEGPAGPDAPTNFRLISWLLPLLGAVLLGGFYGKSRISARRNAGAAAV